MLMRFFGISSSKQTNKQIPSTVLYTKVNKVNIGNYTANMKKSIIASIIFKRKCDTIFKSSRFYRMSVLNSQISHDVLYNQPNIEKRELQIADDITLNTFRDRRTKLMNLVIEKCSDHKKVKNHLVLLPSSTKTFMSENIPYPFRQNTDFLYLTGLKEPDSVLLLHTVQDKSLPEHSSILFIPKTNEHTEQWEGKKMSVDTASTHIGVDAAYFIDDLENYLHSYISNHSNLKFWYNCISSMFPKLQDIVRDFVSNGSITSFDSPHMLVQQLRLIKSVPEIKLMTQTCKIASESLSEVMRFSYPSVLESHLQAKMEFECRLRGADGLAFPPVVAGGDRANTIHYISNNQRIENGEMVLMDAGCEFHGYSSDITRTWPVSGKFTGPQRELYEIILDIQEELIELCRTFPSLDYLFKVMCQSMGKKFQEIGLIPRTVGADDASKAAYEFCPHHVSHYLGMDVHDTSLMSRGMNIKPGMVITVEPGIYIKSDDQRVPPKYRGLCVRVEDDVLITDSSPILLTSDCPRTICDIEKHLSIKT